MPALFYSKDVDQQWKYWYPRVYGYFYKRIDNKSAVEDLTCETINTAFLAENVNNFKAYLWKVAHNYLVRYINTKNTDIMMVGWDESIDLVNSSWPNFFINPEIESHRSQNYSRLKQEMVDCLERNTAKDIDKQIIHLSIIQEQESKQIAQTLNIQADNVRQRLSRTIRKVKNKCIQIWQDFQ